MQITETQIPERPTTTRSLLREYFPRADRRAIDEYVDAVHVYRLFPTPAALDRLVTTHHLLVSSLPTIHLEEL